MDACAGALWIATLQATWIALVAGALLALAFRGTPRRRAGTAATALGLILIATLLAPLPMPRLLWPEWLTLRRAPTDTMAPVVESQHVRTSAVGGRTDASRGEQGRLAATQLRLQRTLGALRSMWGAATQLGAESPGGGTSPAALWRRRLAAIAVLGLGLSLVQLALAVWGAATLARRSTPIADPRPLALLQALTPWDRPGNKRGPRVVELRESDQLTTAATVGWWRPQIVLAADWRSWSEEQLRAVLAHELAHIAGRDFLGGLLARLCVALHWFNPLVRWLAARLELEQELAADREAARTPGVGGPSRYLDSLARLALRRPSSHAAVGLVAGFVSVRSLILRRRIDMLRVMDRLDWVRDRGPHRGRAWGAATTLAVATLAALLTRSPSRGEPPTPTAPAQAPPAAAEPRPDEPVRVARGGVESSRSVAWTRERVDLALLRFPPSQADSPVVSREPTGPLPAQSSRCGVVVIRPAALLARFAGTDVVTELERTLGIDEFIPPELRTADDLTIADIEWLAGQVFLSHLGDPVEQGPRGVQGQGEQPTEPGEPSQRGQIGFTCDAARLTRVIDLLRAMQAAFPGTSEVEEQGRKYLAIPAAPAWGPGPIRLAVLDPRTLLGRNLDAAAPTDTAATHDRRVQELVWSQVAGGALAVLVDTRSISFLDQLTDDAEDDPVAAGLMQLLLSAPQIGVGLDWTSPGDELNWRLVLVAQGAEEAALLEATVRRQLEPLVQLVREGVRRIEPAPQPASATQLATGPMPADGAPAEGVPANEAPQVMAASHQMLPPFLRAALLEMLEQPRITRQAVPGSELVLVTFEGHGRIDSTALAELLRE